MRQPRNRLALERVEKIDTLLDGNAARSKIKDFRTALYPRQYHPSVLEKTLNKRFFAHKVFFRRACQRKNKKCGVNAAKIEFWVYRQTVRQPRNRLALFFMSFLSQSSALNQKPVFCLLRINYSISLTKMQGGKPKTANFF